MTALTVLHLGAMLITFVVVSDAWFVTGLVVLLGASLAWQFWRLWLGGPLSFDRLTLDDAGQVSLSADRWVAGREYRLGNCRVLPGVIVLGLRREDRSGVIHLVLPFDALAPDDARRLRSRARTGTLQGA